VTEWIGAVALLVSLWLIFEGIGCDS
jgi:hypothetical protein